MQNYDIVIIGGGAAGLLASISAAQSGAKVLILEKMKKPGNKLLITGKGRCNITNAVNKKEFIKHIHQGNFLKPAFSTFFSQDIIELLRKNRVETTTERGNRIFPLSNKASDVRNALLTEAKKHQVQIQCNSQVIQLFTQNERITTIEYLSQGYKQHISAQAVILCMGGKSYPATGTTGEGFTLAQSLGHTLAPVHPSLVPLITKENIPERLQGLTLKNAKASIWINHKKQQEAFGELLFTHFGLSGPIILSLSRFVAEQIKHNNLIQISIDLKPALDEKKLDNRLLRDLDENGKKQLHTICKQWLPAALIDYFIEQTGIPRDKEGHQINTKERRKIKTLLKGLSFTIKGTRSFKEAIITAGGVNTPEVESQTMKSKLYHNLFFAGEIIDLDADTGGFNLQIAFSTGWLAGQACAKQIINKQE